jgi:tetratricopeptide (TPR) repeat protein
MKRLKFLVFLSAITIINQIASAQEKATKSEVDSLLSIVGHPNVSYSIQFQFSLEQLPGGTPIKSNPLATLDIEALEKKLIGTSDDAAVYEQLVYRYLLEKDQKRVLENLEKAYEQYTISINQNPSDPDLVLNLSNVLRATQNPAPAMEALDYGVQQFPDNPQLHLNRFQVLYYDMGLIEQGGKYMDSLFSVFPENYSMAFMGFMKDYGQFMMESNGEMEGIESSLVKLDKHLALDPQDPMRIYLKQYGEATLYLMLKGYMAGEGGYEGNDMMLLPAKGLLQTSQIKVIKENIKELKKAAKGDALPESFIHKGLAAHYLVLGEVKNLMEHIDVLRKLAKDATEIESIEEAALLMSLIKTGVTYEEKKRAFEVKRQKAPVTKDYVAMSIMYDEAGLPEKALEFAQMAVDEDPTHPKGWEMIGYLNIQKEDYTSAMEAIESGYPFAADPKYPFLLSTICLAATEGKAVANTRLQELLNSLPEDEKGLAFRAVFTK